MTYPSSLVSFVDVPEISRVWGRFYYNFFVPDESVSDKYDARAQTILRRSGQSVVGGRPSPRAMQELTRRVPRFIRITWRPLKTNRREDSERVPFLRIRDNLDDIQDESTVSNNHFTGLPVQDTGLDDKLTPFLEMSLNLTEEENPTSPTDKAKELNSRTSPDVSPRFLANAMNNQPMGAAFIDEDTGKNKFQEARQAVRDITLNLQLNNKFAGDMIRTAVRDTAGIYSDEMKEILPAARAVQGEALGQNTANSLDPSDFELIVEPVRVRMFDVGQADTESRILGYIIEKFEVTEDGGLEKVRDIIIENPRSTSLLDTRVKYGATYVYQIKTIAQVDFQAMSEDSSDILSSTMMISSKPSKRIVIECTESKPPTEPVDFKGVWSYQHNKLCLMWNFPVNPQRDIKKFQIFRRKSILEPFEMIAMLDFDDSEVLQPDREDIDPNRRIYTKMPQLTFYDDDFKMTSKYIYAICSIDARNMTSNYSMQLELSFDRSSNKLVSKKISNKGAPKQYPNLYLLEDLFVDTIRDSGHSRVHLYFDPEYLSITDNNGNDLGLLKSRRGKKGISNKYQLQFINVDHQKERKVSIVIDDMRPRTPAEQLNRSLIIARRNTRRARRRRNKK